VVVERYKIWDISYHAGTAPRNAPSRIYGLQIKKGFDVAQYWAKIFNLMVRTRYRKKKKKEDCLLLISDGNVLWIFSNEVPANPH
jgi:hypothetical protein